MSYIMYNKLFTKILDSSVWMQSTATRIVWITFLAAMDEDGFVRIASPANVAHKARVSLKEAIHALEVLEGPDDCSFDPDNEGRRVERVEGGWIVLNAGKYRDLVTRQVIREQTKERVRKFREKKALGSGNANVTPSEALSGSVAHTESDQKSPIPPFEKQRLRVRRKSSKPLRHSVGEAPSSKVPLKVPSHWIEENWASLGYRASKGPFDYDRFPAPVQEEILKAYNQATNQ
jgi:hypothetical protein